MRNAKQRLIVAFTFAAAIAACGRPAPPQRSNDLFVDATEASGIRFTHHNGMQGVYYLAEITGSGIALLDYDNDGKLDVLVLQGAPLGPGEHAGAPNDRCSSRLYHNELVVNADGSRNLKFADVTDASGLCSQGYGMGIAVGDFDNDGCADVFISHFGAPNQLFRNNCNGTFTDVTAKAGVAGHGDWGMSASFVDYDRDGFLDLAIEFAQSFERERWPSAVAARARRGRRPRCAPRRPRRSHCRVAIVPSPAHHRPAASRGARRCASQAPAYTLPHLGHGVGIDPGRGSEDNPPAAVASNTPSTTTRRVETAHYCAIPP